MQKTATELLASLQAANASNDTMVAIPEINWGKLLPSGQSLYNLLQQVAEEEAQDNTAANVDVDAEENIVGSKLKKGKKRQVVNTNIDKNPLIRLLLKISKQDIRSLREQAWNISSQYRFYDFNTTLSRSSPPLTASHTFPTGGAAQQVDRFLTHRKQQGITTLSQRCEDEKTKIKHKYVGNYPCQKNRRLRRQLDASEDFEDCVQESRQLAQHELEEEAKEGVFWKEIESQQHDVAWNHIPI